MASYETALATNQLSITQQGATAVTGMFSGAVMNLTAYFRALWTTLATNPMIWLTAAITVGTIAWNKYRQSVEDARRAAEEAGEEFRETVSSVNDATGKYQSLRDELLNVNTTEERQKEIKTQLLELQRDLNEKYGDEYGKVNLVNGAYKDQIESLRSISREKAKGALHDAEILKGYTEAEDVMTGQRTYQLGAMSTGSAAFDDILNLVDKYSSQGIDKTINMDTGLYELSVTGNPNDALKAIDSFMVDLEGLKTRYEDDDLITNIFDSSSVSYSEVDDKIEDYSQKYQDYLHMQIMADDELADGYEKAENAVKAFNLAVASGDVAKIEEAMENLEQVRTSFELDGDDTSASDKWRKYAELIDNVFTSAHTEKFKLKDAIENNEDGIRDFAQMLKNTNASESDVRAMGEDDFSNDFFDKFRDKASTYTTTVEEMIEVLEELGYIESDVAEKSLEVAKPLSKEEMTSAIKELSSGFRAINDIYSDIQDGNDFNLELLDVDGFKSDFGDLGDAYSDFIDKITSTPNDISGCQNSFNTLINTWLNAKGILSGLSEETADLTITMLENAGVTNASKLVNEELAANKKLLSLETDNVTIDTIEEINEFISESIASAQAKQQIAQLALTKLHLNNNPINTEADIDQIIALANTAGASAEALKKLNQAKSEVEIANNLKGEGNVGGLRQYAENYFDLKDGSFNYQFTPLNPEDFYAKNQSNYSGSNSHSGSAGKEEAKPKPFDKEQFEWGERSLERLTRAEEKASDAVEDNTKSYLEQLSAVEKLIMADNELIGANKVTVEQCAKQWEDAQKKLIELFGEERGKDLIDKIAGHSLDTEHVEIVEDDDPRTAQADGKNLIKRSDYEEINGVIEIYDKLIKTQDKYDQAFEERAKNIQKQYEIRVNEIKSFLDEVNSEFSKAQSDLKVKETTGKEITEADYRELIDLADEQIDLYEQQMDVYEDQMSELDEGSEEYRKAQAGIADCEQAINQCRENQAQWNEEIKNLPIRKIGRYLELLKNIKQDLQNFISQEESLGVAATKDQFQNLIDISQKQIAKLLEQQGLLRDKLSSYEFNSGKYNETHNEIQDIDDEISDLIQSQNEWNQSILNIPIDNIGKYNEDLQSISDSLGEILSGYDAAITAVTNAVDKEIESIDRLRETTQEEYESDIQGYQDKLDLLQKQNEERQVQLALEQAQYDLDRARNQKTNAVIRDGEKVYEADEEAVRGAQEARNNAEYDKLIHDLQNQISDLEEKRDGILEGYDDQIEKLDEIKERWSSITDDIRQAADSMKAADILGSGWQDKILAGDDGELFESVKNMYANIFNQKDQYEQQIASNERLTEMMGKYVELWAGGALSFDSVATAIRDLAAKMQDGYSSLDNLNSLMGIQGGGDLSSILSSLQNSVGAAAGQFEGYFDIAQSNNKLISQYTSSWEETRENLRQQIAALESTAGSVKSVAGSLKVLVSKYSRDRDHDRSDNRSDRKKSDKNSPPHNDDQDPDNGPGKNIPSKHNGVLGGYVGDNKSASARERLGALKHLATEDLEQDEYPLVALGNELVFTEGQQRQLLENFMNMPADSPTYRLPDYSATVNRNTAPNVSITMGDVNLPNVKDPDGFVKFLDRNFESAMRQNFSKVFKH